jgi:hypothetical protein
MSPYEMISAAPPGHWTLFLHLNALLNLWNLGRLGLDESERADQVRASLESSLAAMSERERALATRMSAMLGEFDREGS